MEKNNVAEENKKLQINIQQNSSYLESHENYTGLSFPITEQINITNTFLHWVGYWVERAYGGIANEKVAHTIKICWSFILIAMIRVGGSTKGELQSEREREREKKERKSEIERKRELKKINK